MDVRFTRLRTMGLTFLLAFIICFGGLSLASDAPGRPTNLRVSHVHDLTITLTWNKPLTSTGAPFSVRLLYRVSYRAIGGITQRLPLTSTESAQLGLNANTQYNIFVKAVLEENHLVQSAWSESLKVNTKDFVPAKPTSLRVARAAGSVVTVVWNEPRTTLTRISDSSNLNYKISYRMLASQITRQLSIASQRVSLHLAANSRYELKVRAFKTFDAQVYGPWSETLTLKTNESVPSKPPANVKVVSSTPSSINISWGPIPANGQNGVIRGFVVFFRKQGAISWSKRDVKLVYSEVITGLPTGRQYEVKVVGYTKVGRGTMSALKSVIVGGRFITTTKITTTRKPTTLKSTSTTKQTTKQSTKSSTLVPTKAVTQKTQGSSTERPRTVTVKVDTLPSVPTKEPSKSTGVFYSPKPKGKTTIQTTGALVYQSTPAVGLASQVDKEPKSDFSNKILMIGAPAAGALLVLIILIAVFVSTRRRSRKARLQNGEFPLVSTDSRQQRRTREAVTRGAFSIRYEPPAPHFQGEDSMTQGLLQSDQPAQVNGSLPRAVAEDAPLLAASSPEKCKLSVDLNTEHKKLAESRSSGLYDSIGSLKGAGSKNEAKSDGGERYVTHGQMAATCDKAPLSAAAKIPRHECNGAAAKATPQGNIYENLSDSEHLYDTLNLEGKEDPVDPVTDPVYENTRVLPSPQENTGSKEGEYERIPI